MKETILKSISLHRELLSGFEKNCAGILEKIAAEIIETFERGGTLYLCGNGGSAADAQHVAGEFIGRFRSERRALPAIALNTDTSVMTCVSNDYSYKDVFRRQAEALIKPGDLLWVFSTSGSSPNILACAELAGTRKVKVVSFTGRTNSPVEKLSDICMVIDSPVTSGAQEMHQLAYHIICDLVEQHFVK